MKFQCLKRLCLAKSTGLAVIIYSYLLYQKITNSKTRSVMRSFQFPNKIADGFERSSDADFSRFLIYD